MSKVVILAELTATEGNYEALLEKMLQHSAASREEPGCIRFDLLAPRKGENRLAVYEIYRDQAAFDAHAGSERFQAFREATADLVAGRRIDICEPLDSGDA